MDTVEPVSTTTKSSLSSFADTSAKVALIVEFNVNRSSDFYWWAQGWDKVTDDIRLGSCEGGDASGQIHIKNQKFGNVERQSTIFTGSNFEAIVGMAYPALAERGVTPVFDEMIE